EMQRSMDDNCGVYRTDETLRDQEGILASLQDRFRRVGIQDKSKRYNTDLMEAVELGFLLDLAQTIVAAARARTESRGGHYRGDFDKRDDVSWLKHSLAWKIDGDTKLDYKPVVIDRYQPTERKY
ncbi:MAG: succinate dehydrogenase/fumarate reductase flavoprotein subunit, partial [Actinobacteria bacterium]|nr:succinate dehydrogenase/fumarate reductase flavoprotein subunit [Actinomycetota bacterium]